ncbi:hypothetical protein O5D80_005909 [Batrachochytrium dendrobatidis]|nr:hypothetical protein O5D80_005909 [Batrachochytrium dendrobatidis]
MFGVRKDMHRTQSTTNIGMAGNEVSNVLFRPASLQVLSFVASTCKPLGTSGQFASATKIVGRFQHLRTISKLLPCLCEYIDISKNSHGRIYVVSEGVTGCVSLQDLISSCPAKNIRSIERLSRWTRELVHALMYLHANGLIHRNIHPKHIYVDKSDHIIISNYGLYYLTGNGQDVTFPIGYPHYLSPETIAAGPCFAMSSSPKADVWSLGILLLELYFGPEFLNTDISDTGQVLKTILAWKSPSSRFLQSDSLVDINLKHFIYECLEFTPSKRASVNALANHPFLQHISANKLDIGPEQLKRSRYHADVAWVAKPYLYESKLAQRASAIAVDDPFAKDTTATTKLPSFQKANLSTTPSLANSPTRSYRYPLTLFELFHYWKMLGGDLEALVLKQQGVSNIPALFKLPTVVRIGENVEEKLQSSLVHLRANLFRDAFVDVPVEAVLSKIDFFESSLFSQDGIVSGRSYNGVGDIYRDEWRHITNFTALELDAIWEAYLTAQGSGSNGLLQLALSARESDMRYQYHRTKLMYGLLCAYPTSIDSIQYEAVSDIPPLLRGKIWAALLNVTGDTDAAYDAIDKETEAETDRQLDLDIPRCHQYNELLSSPIGHQKLKRVLKAWIENEKGQHVYWQGLDSMCAPFLVLNFDDEALVFASMTAFISKYCHGFFVHDNSKLMREFMLAFRYILSFHDPELSAHLYTIGLGPELFAISWFMTLYAHVFPLDKIYHLWDYFLVAPPFIFIYVGVFILQQHRDQLLQSDFSQAMLFFSEMPSIDVEKCIVYSIQAVKITPPSLLSHLHLAHTASPQDPNMLFATKRFSFMSSKKGIVGRLGIDDLIQMRKHSVLLDIRRLDMFQRGHIAGSLHLDTSQVTSVSFGLKINISRSRYIVLISDDEQDGEDYALMLIKEKQPRVSLMVIQDPDVLTEQRIVVCTCVSQLIGSNGSSPGMSRCTQ